MKRSEIADVDSERAVLGSVLLDGRRVFDVLAEVGAEDFAAPKTRLVFEAMRDLARDSQPIDLTTVHARLQVAGTLQTVGGVAELMNCTQAVATAANVVFYARQVRGRARLRALAAAARRIAEEAATAVNAEEFLATAQNELLGLTQSDELGDVVSFKDLVIETYRQLERRADERIAPGIETGLPGLDLDLGGLPRGEVTVLGARPAMGKTGLAQNIALAAAEAGRRVLFASLEMTELQLAHRWTGMRAGVNTRHLDHRPWELEADEWARIANAFRGLSERDGFVWRPRGAARPEDLRIRARRLHAQRPVDLVVVDYLQLFAGDTREGNREQEVSSVSRALKHLANELDCAVLALSQLSRLCERRSPPRPENSDLRDSGAIEQDAAQILFLFRPWVYDRGAPADEVELIIGKHRFADPGSLALKFDPRHQRFVQEDA